MTTNEAFSETNEQCVLKGTRIVTNEGLMRVEDMGQAYVANTFSEARAGLTVLCSDGRWRKVTRHYCGGERPICRVRLNNGLIISSSQQNRLMSVGGWAKVSELEVGS